MKYLLIFLIFLTLSFTGFGQSSLDELDKEHTALIIIDIQEFYFPGGSLPLVEAEMASANAGKILNAFRKQKMLVVHVRHNASSGAEIHADVKPAEGEKIITKDEVNAFSGTDLLDYLKQNEIEDIVFVGMQTHMCLEAATRAAHDYGFNCIVVEDACATRDLKYGEDITLAKDVHNATLSTLSHTYARIMTKKEFLNYMEE